LNGSASCMPPECVDAALSIGHYLAVVEVGGSMEIRRIRVAYVVASSPTRRREVLRALRAVVDHLKEVSDLSGVPLAEARNSATAIVLAEDSMPTSFLASALKKFREAHAAAYIVLCTRSRDRTIHQLATMVRLGLDDYVLTDDEGFRDELTRKVSRRLANTLPHEVVTQLLPSAPYEIQCLWSFCIRAGFRDMKVRDVARAFYYSPSTVTRRLHKVRLPSLGWLIDIGRCAHAAHRLDTTQAHVSVIAKSLGYPSSGAFANDVRRWTGRSPTQLRSRGAIDFLIRTIRSELNGPQS
jgi:AraC-like DNA-binding protein